MPRSISDRIAKLKTARDSAEDRLAEILLNRKPTYNIDGQDVSWTDYHDMLTRTIASLTQEIERLEGPAVFTSVGYT
jgi:hypothetical protein